MKENWETEFFFALNILNEAESLVCAPIKIKKFEYSLKPHYRSCLYSLNSGL